MDSNSILFHYYFSKILHIPYCRTIILEALVLLLLLLPYSLKSVYENKVYVNFSVHIRSNLEQALINFSISKMPR